MGPSRSQTDVELADAVESGLTSSFVSRLFQGLHRSSLTCPYCGRHSNTFDPYLCVSLPLPQKCLRPVYVTVVTLREATQVVTIGLNLNMYDTVRELREAVSSDTGIPVNQVWFSVTLLKFLRQEWHGKKYVSVATIKQINKKFYLVN